MREASALRNRLAEASPLERRLREWGLAYGWRPPSDDDEEREPDAETPLSRIAVDRTRERDLRDDEGWRPCQRVNLTRARIRQMLGKSCRVPAWAGGDPIRAPRSYGGGVSAEPINKDVEEVEDAFTALYRFDKRAALALRASYCLLGRRPLSERIAWLARASDTQVSRTGYRAALSRGKVHMEAALKIAG